MSAFDRPRRSGTDGDCPTPPPVDPGDSHRLRIVEDRLLITIGVDGTNGKLGNLRKTVEGHGALFRYLGAAVAGSLVTAAIAIYTAGQKDGARERDIVTAVRRAESAEHRAETAERTIEALRAEVATLRTDVRELVRPRGSHRYQPAAPAPGDAP